MGHNKRMMDENDAKRREAMAIALEAGVLEQCEAHDDCLFEGHGDLKKAYRIGNSHFTAGQLKGIFKSRTEMTNHIKKIIENYPADECPSCAKIRDED